MTRASSRRGGDLASGVRQPLGERRGELAAAVMDGAPAERGQRSCAASAITSASSDSASASWARASAHGCASRPSAGSARFYERRRDGAQSVAPGRGDVEQTGTDRAAEPLLARCRVEGTAELADVGRDRTGALRSVEQHGHVDGREIGGRRARGPGDLRTGDQASRGATASASRSAATARTLIAVWRRSAPSGPSRPGMLALGDQHLVAGGEIEPEHDTDDSLARRRRQRDVLGRRRQQRRVRAAKRVGGGDQRLEVIARTTVADGAVDR